MIYFFRCLSAVAMIVKAVLHPDNSVGRLDAGSGLSDFWVGTLDVVLVRH